MATVNAKLGNTSYEMTETPTPGVLKVVRMNSDGETTFYFPAKLIAEYMAEKMRGRMATFFDEAVGNTGAAR